MVDTIRFHAQFPEVEVGSEIYHRGLAAKKAKLVFRAHGSNGDLVKLRYGRVYRDGVVNVNVSDKGVFITTTMARDPLVPGSPNTFPPLSAEAADERLMLRQSHLESKGLRVDLRECALSRVDIHTDVRIKGSYSEYAEVMQMCDLQKLSPSDLGGKRAAFREKVDKRSRLPLRAHTYGRTWTQRAVIAYSKPSQLRTQKGHRDYAERVADDLAGDDVLRFEGRYYNAEAVRGGLCMASGADLIVAWDALPGHLSELIEETLCVSEAEGPTISANLGLSERFSALAEVNGRGKKTAFLAMAAALVESKIAKGAPMDLEYLQALFRDVGMKKRDRDEVLSDLASAMCPSGTRTLGERLSDLRSRLHGSPYEWPAP